MAEDEAEDLEEARERQQVAAERAAAAAAKKPQPLDRGGGLYFYERALLWAKQAWADRAKPSQALQQPLGSPGAAAAAKDQPAMASAA